MSEETKDPIAEARALVQLEEERAQAAYIAEVNEVGRRHGYNLRVRADIVTVKV